MLLSQSRIITAAIALTLGGSMVLAKPPASADFPGVTSQAQSLAQAPGGFRNRQVRERGLGGGKLMEQLNLSEAQKQQLAAIRQKYQGQIQQLRENMRSERQELRDLMAGTADEATIRRQHEQVVQLSQQMHNLRFESMLAMRQVLTVEQRSQFAQLMQQRQERQRERFRDRLEQDQF
jgi:Spy/CpxP family protein refolding chaperone